MRKTKTYAPYAYSEGICMLSSVTR